MANTKSGDMFLGVPFNFGFYSVMTHMFAAVHGMRAGKLYHTFGDAHIYSNHFNQVREQLDRKPIEASVPMLWLDRTELYNSITDYKLEDIHVKGYESHSFIKAKVAK